MVGAEAFEQVVEAFLAQRHVAGALVARAVPPAAHVALDHHLVATALERVADVAAHRGVGIVNVDVVHAVVEGVSHVFAGLCRVKLAERAAADADLAHADAGAAQRAVGHVRVLFESRFLLTGEHRQNHANQQNRDKKSFHKYFFFQAAKIHNFLYSKCFF